MEYLLEILNNILYGPEIPYLLKAEPITTAALITAGGSILGGLFGGGGQRRAARRAANEKKRLQRELDVLEQNRQPIINPYENIADLSAMIQNPYDNLSVATQAAEIQAEQADIALANTLDALAATGVSAGGATALAQAALQSKRDIAATIEQQEAQNEKLRAGGEAQRQQALMAEAQRMQQADILGREFVYGQQERRESEQLNRKQAQITGAAQQQANYASGAAAQSGALMSAIGNIGSAFVSNMPAPTPPPYVSSVTSGVNFNPSSVVNTSVTPSGASSVVFPISAGGGN